MPPTMRAPRALPLRDLPRLLVSMRQVTDMTHLSDDVLRQIPWHVLPFVRNGNARLYLFRHVEVFVERLFARRLARGEPESIESLVQLASELDPMVDTATHASHALHTTPPDVEVSDESDG